MTSIGDSVFHAYAVGFDNGVYGNFINPVQVLLLSQKGSPKDDELDVQEACSDAVRLGHKEMRRYWETATTTDSPQADFPFDGASLVDPDGPHLKRIAKIKEQISRGDLSLYKRRAAKHAKLLQYADVPFSPHILPSQS